MLDHTLHDVHYALTIHIIIVYYSLGAHGQLVNEKTRKWFAKLQPLTSPTTNHSNYRRALATVPQRHRCIPYLG